MATIFGAQILVQESLCKQDVIPNDGISSGKVYLQGDSREALNTPTALQTAIAYAQKTWGYRKPAVTSRFAMGVKAVQQEGGETVWQGYYPVSEG